MTTMRSIPAIALVLALAVACTDTEAPQDPFDRSAMLTAMADRVIIPRYAALQAATATLQNAIADLTAAPSAENLASARNAYVQTAIAWQFCQVFEFGPADAVTGTLSQDINTFPSTVSKIERAISTADTTLNNFDRDARGLPALDYLLFAADAVTTMQGLTAEPVRGAYLRAVARDVASQAARVYTAWTSTYRADFLSRGGTDAGSAVTQVFNALNRGFELLKNYKIGIPAGLQAGQTGALPTSVEAPYSGISWRLARLHQQAVHDVWTGRAADSTAFPSFKAYIAAMGGSMLEASSLLQFDALARAAQAIPADSDLAALCANGDSRVSAYYTELQKLTRFIKSETSSLLGISITYSSGDGD